MESPHGWYRDTAQRLLFERQDKSAVEPLQKLALNSEMPQARYCALWTLEGLDATAESDVLSALDDQAAPIRKLGVQLAESLLAESEIVKAKVFSVADDPDAGVRFQLTFTLGEIDDPRATQILAKYAKQYAGDHWMRAAVLSSITGSTDRLMLELFADQNFMASDSGQLMLREMAIVVGAQNDVTATTNVLDKLAEGGGDGVERNVQRLIVRSIGAGLQLTGQRFDETTLHQGKGSVLVDSILQEAKQTALGVKMDPKERELAIELLGNFPLSRCREVFIEVLASNTDANVQIATINALGNYHTSEIAEIILAGWSQYLPEVLTQAIQTLLSREDWTKELLQTSLNEGFSVAQIDSNQRDLLLENSNEQIQQLAKQIFGNERGASREDVIKQYQSALEIPGNDTRGEKVFTKTCAVCHSIAGKGHAVGPDLTSIGSLDPAAMLVHILDPNRYVLPRYVQYVVLDVNGKTHTGLMSSQTTSSVTLLREERAAETILRSQIDTIQATQKSLMPEGLETKLSRNDMADLIAYIAIARQRHGVRPENEQQADRDFGTPTRSDRAEKLTLHGLV